MVVEGLALILDNFFDMALLVVVDLNLFDAVVGPQIALEVVSEEIG